VKAHDYWARENTDNLKGPMAKQALEVKAPVPLVANSDIKFIAGAPVQRVGGWLPEQESNG
jgi:hypothetical protein